jgi:hypothetical protein
VAELSYVGLVHREAEGRERDNEPELDPLGMTLRYWEESTGSPPTTEETALLEDAIRAGFDDVEVPA